MTQVSGLMEVRVAHRQEEALEICSLELVSAGAEPLLAFSAGSHVDVLGPTGITRQYSLCSDEGDASRYVIAVLRSPESRGGSEAIYTQVKSGDLLKISQPKNHFPLAHAAAHSLLLAGGIGITPILCMAERLANIGADFQLHYCARSLERMAFVQRIQTSAWSARAHLHVDDGLAAQQFDLAATFAAADRTTHIYVCGPQGFMDAVLAMARSLNWPEDQLHYEFFAAEVVQSDADERFEVQLASTGQCISVGKEQTVAQALLDAGVELEMSCAQGVCGTCVTRVLAGTPDHRDMFLTPDEQAENDQFLPCCSRSKTPLLVLDL